MGFKTCDIQIINEVDCFCIDIFALHFMVAIGIYAANNLRFYKYSDYNTISF